MEEVHPHLFVSRKFPRVRLAADSEWRRFVIEGAQYGEDGVMEVFLCAFYSYLSGKGGVLVHASLHQLEGRRGDFHRVLRYRENDTGRTVGKI